MSQGLGDELVKAQSYLIVQRCSESQTSEHLAANLFVSPAPDVRLIIHFELDIRQCAVLCIRVPSVDPFDEVVGVDRWRARARSCGCAGWGVRQGLFEATIGFEIRRGIDF